MDCTAHADFVRTYMLYMLFVLTTSSICRKLTIRLHLGRFGRRSLAQCLPKASPHPHQHSRH